MGPDDKGFRPSDEEDHTDHAEVIPDVGQTSDEEREAVDQPSTVEDNTVPTEPQGPAATPIKAEADHQPEPATEQPQPQDENAGDQADANTDTGNNRYNEKPNIAYTTYTNFIPQD